MLHGGEPSACVRKSRVSTSIGSPVNEHFTIRADGFHAAERAIRYTVGAAATFVIANVSSAAAKRAGSKRPASVPTGMPSASGAMVPCQRPWPHAGDDGQK